MQKRYLKSVGDNVPAQLRNQVADAFPPWPVKIPVIDTTIAPKALINRLRTLVEIVVNLYVLERRRKRRVIKSLSP